MTEKMFIISTVVVFSLFIFRLTECEMKRIEANRSIQSVTCTPLSFCRDEKIK